MSVLQSLGLVGHVLRCLWCTPYISLEEGHSGVCLLGNIVCVLSPRHVTADGYSKVLCISLHGKFLVVDTVDCADLMPLVGDSQYFAFVGVE